MALRVIGAGLGRTGTHSLKLALEQLLGGPCYHMLEVLQRPDHGAVWQEAIDGELPRWDDLFAGYRSGVDWPVAAFWRELAAAYPDALILLSVRDASDWWTSANQTIFELTRREPPPDPAAAAQLRMAADMLRTRFTPEWDDEHAAKRAYERHNDAVRSEAAPDRLVEWHPGDGWDPICEALGVPVPGEPFPHVNTTREFRQMVGLDSS
jgi:hypothetical protein